MVGTDIGLLCHYNEARVGLFGRELHWALIITRSKRMMDCDRIRSCTAGTDEDRAERTALDCNGTTIDMNDKLQ
jgi:hypothetical protein